MKTIILTNPADFIKAANKIFGNCEILGIDKTKVLKVARPRRDKKIVDKNQGNLF